MVKKFNEWAQDQNYQLDTIGYNQTNDMQTLYDEDLITRQVNDWLSKLIGLCNPVPVEDRPELVEQIVKTIRTRLL